MKSSNKKLIAMLPFVTCLRLANLLPAIIVGAIIDNLHQENFNQSNYLVLALFSLSFFQFILTPISARLIAIYVQQQVIEACDLWTETILNKDFDFFKGGKIGALIKIIDRGIVAYETHLTFLINQILPNSIELLGIIIYLSFILTPNVSLILLFGAFVLIAVSWKGVHWRRRFIDKVNNAEDQVSENFSVLLQAARSLRVAGAKITGLKFMHKAYKAYCDACVKLAFISGALGASQIMLVTITTGFVLLSGIFLISNDEQNMSVGTFVVIFSFTGLFLNNVQKLIDAYKNIDQYKLDIKALNNLLDMPEFRSTGKEVIGDNVELELLPQSIKIKENILAKLADNLIISQGSKIAITGATGVGKSTLIELLSGMIKSDAKVLLNKNILDELSETNISTFIYVDLQENAFLAGPFKQTVLFGVNDQSDDYVKTLMRDLRLEKFIAAYASDDFFAVAKCSAGERRRFGLLRALLSKQHVLILDEPTSALDKTTAQQIWGVIFAACAEKTLICVTHDKDTIEQFDYVLNIENQEIKISRKNKPTD